MVVEQAPAAFADAVQLAYVESLEAKVAELEQANRHLIAVAADVAHDLRSPLQAVSGFTELLIRREGARLDETSQSFLAHVLSATQGMRELVETVLEHRRSSSVLLNVTRFDCKEVANAVILRLGRDLDEAGTRVVIDDLPVLCADRVQVGRVLQNLVANAIRATPRGRKPLTIAARRLAQAWEISVTDDGIGVPEADRDRIFEVFERGPGATGPGKGMGLAICRAIIERHGGHIGVDRAPGGGSRFWFTLPDAVPAGATR